MCKQSCSPTDQMRNEYEAKWGAEMKASKRLCYDKSSEEDGLVADAIGQHLFSMFTHDRSFILAPLSLQQRRRVNVDHSRSIS